MGKLISKYIKSVTICTILGKRIPVEKYMLEFNRVTNLIKLVLYYTYIEPLSHVEIVNTKDEIGKLYSSSSTKLGNGMVESQYIIHLDESYWTGNDCKSILKEYRIRIDSLTCDSKIFTPEKIVLSSFNDNYMEINFRSNFLKMFHKCPSKFDLDLKGELIAKADLYGTYVDMNYDGCDNARISHIMPYFNFYDSQEMFHVRYELNDNLTYKQI